MPSKGALAASIGLGDLRAAPVGRALAPPASIGAAGGGVEVDHANPAEAGRNRRAGEHPARSEEAFFQRLLHEGRTRRVCHRMAGESEQPRAVEAAVLGNAGAVGIEIAKLRRQPHLDPLWHQFLQKDDIGVHSAQRGREMRGAGNHVGHILVKSGTEQPDFGQAGIEGQDAQHRRGPVTAPPGSWAGSCG